MSQWVDGTASFFGGPPDSKSGNKYKLTIDSGSCGYGEIDPRLYPFYAVAGLHPSNAIVKERPEAGCGSCLEIECRDGRNVCYHMQPLTALITDQCDASCNSTNVNLHVFAFEQLAPIRVGRVAIRYRLIECDPADAITIHVSDYRAEEGGWIRMTFKNLAGDGGLTAVELAKSATTSAAGPTRSWQQLQNTFGANWEASTLPTPPMDIRLTNSLQQKVIVTEAITIAGLTGDIETNAQFPLQRSGSPSSQSLPPSAQQEANNTVRFSAFKQGANVHINNTTSSPDTIVIGTAVQPVNKFNPARSALNSSSHLAVPAGSQILRNTEAGGNSSWSGPVVDAAKHDGWHARRMLKARD
eukprot:gene2237-2549_t